MDTSRISRHNFFVRGCLRMMVFNTAVCLFNSCTIGENMESSKSLGDVTCIFCRKGKNTTWPFSTIM